MSASKKTPVRNLLVRNSELNRHVKDGIEAMKRADRRLLSKDVAGAVGDSIDIDAALLERHGTENRWDYLVGHTASNTVIGVEPHSAKMHEVDTVIKKKRAARQQLEPHLKPGRYVLKWLWVSPGKNHFADTEKVRRILDQNGIEFVGGKVLAKHLPKKDTNKKTQNR